MEEITADNIFEYAQGESIRAHLKILEHPLVTTIHHTNGWTPLHWLAIRGINKIKLKVFNFPGVLRVKTDFNSTPIHWLVEGKFVTMDMLEKRFPWFDFSEWRHVNHELITELTNTPNSILFTLD